VIARNIGVISVSLLLAAGCDMSAPEKKTSQLETPAGPVTYDTTTLEKAPPQKITVVTGEDLRKLRAIDDEALAFLHAYAGASAQPTLESYDAAFANWQQSKSPTYTNEQVIRLVGGVLGNRCVSDLDMEWVVVSDQFGTDYAVRSRTRDVTAFPFSTVLKRVEDHEHEFVASVFAVTKHSIQSGDAAERK